MVSFYLCPRLICDQIGYPCVYLCVYTTYDIMFYNISGMWKIYLVLDIFLDNLNPKVQGIAG